VAAVLVEFDAQLEIKNFAKKTPFALAADRGKAALARLITAAVAVRNAKAAEEEAVNRRKGR